MKEADIYDLLDASRIRHKAGQIEDALTGYRKVVAALPNLVEGHLRIGMALEDLGRFRRAIEAYETCTRLAPTDPQASTNIGECYRKIEKFEEAIAAYDRALGVDPTYVYALAGRGESYRMLDRFDEALVSLSQAIEHAPAHLFAVQGKAAVLNACHRYTEALPFWERALQLDPQSAFALEGIRFCRAQLTPAKPSLLDEIRVELNELSAAATASSTAIDRLESLDEHVRTIVRHHFSEDTGTPFWLRWARQADFDPLTDIQGAADLHRFGTFDKGWLRGAPHEDWTPRALAGKPFHVFETGGTTGLPTQRLSWNDHNQDYEIFAPSLSDAHFPRGCAWLILGPTGPRRLRLAMEHLAQVRGGIAYHVDLDPRWVRKVLAKGDTETAAAYQRHVIEQAVTILRNREVNAVFTTPRLLESLGEAISLHRHGVKGVLCGGTSMSPQTVRFLVDEVLEGRSRFVAVYGNTLMGLAESQPVGVNGNYEVIYHAPVPRALLRVVDDAGTDVPYGTRGRVQLTTMTREFFMPNLLERDEAIRREPTERHPWDGVGDVRPLGGPKKGTIEGVY